MPKFFREMEIAGWKLTPYTEDTVLVGKEVIVGESNWKPDDNHKLYELVAHAEIPIDIADNWEFQKSLRIEGFVPSGLIWAINRQGAISLQKGHLFDDYFSLDVAVGDHNLCFRRVISWRDSPDPTLWSATVQYFGSDLREYVVNSLFLNEKFALDLVHDWTNGDFVVERL